MFTDRERERERERERVERTQAAPATMTSSMTSVLVISVLLQVVRQTCAQDPTRIFLILDNNDFDQQYKPILKDLTNTPIQLTHDGVRFSGSIPPKVKEAGHKILYISARFSENTKDEKLTWGAGKTAEDLATIVSEIFSGSQELFVTVVFPEICVKTFWGYEFVEKFEAKVQESNRNIGIGIPRVKIYLFVNQEKKNIEGERQSETPVSNTVLDKIKNSIFFNLEENRLALFSSKENRWIQKTDALFNSVLNVLQKTKIEEAESVTVVIKAECVNKYSEDNVADAVHSILGTTGHEHQRIKIELKCLSVNRPNQEEHLSNTLIDQLKNKFNRASIYGKRPSVVIHMATKDFENDVKRKLKVGRRTHLYASLQGTRVTIFDAKNKIVETPIEAIKSAEEVSLQVNCHSNFESEISRNLPTICGQSPTELAQSVKNLFSGIDGSVLDKKRIELRLYACNSGTTMGKKYVRTFLDTLKKHIIDEVLSFVGWITQQNKEVIIAVPMQLKYYAEDILQNKYPEELKDLREKSLGMWQLGHLMYACEHNIYGRFTIRTKLDDTEYITFPVLPATEYGVYKLKIPRS